MAVCAIIMAGGSGTRFWPWSRSRMPKQFLPVTSDKTMIEETVTRLLPKIPMSQIYTVADEDQSDKISSILGDLPKENVTVEPLAKNTAPSLLLATAKIYLKDPSTVIAALPADHLISDQSLFLKKLESCAAMASNKRVLITFGIRPTYPATGYGYIQFDPSAAIEVEQESFFSVTQFKEKPNLPLAEKFIQDGNFYWNSGMFIWQASVFEEQLKQFSPEMHVYWERILAALKNHDHDRIVRIFEEIPSISIDYALMEKASEVVMCEGNFGWSDVGSWSSLIENWPKDDDGNASKGETLCLKTKNCLVYNPKKFTALIGIQDLIVVETEDALLICHKDMDQKVKDVVETLKKSGRQHLT